MSLLSSLYDRVLNWSRHPHGPWYLAGVSFAESSFFPVPPDVMLAPMCMAQRQRAWRLALITTGASVLGGAAGYAIGYFAFEAVQPWLQTLGYAEGFARAQDWFAKWGFWVLFAAGFTPIPYKLFTISAGVVAMSIPAFLLASIVGRGLRFFMVAGLMYWGGEAMDSAVRKYIDRIGWLVLGLLVIAVLVYKFMI